MIKKNKKTMEKDFEDNNIHYVSNEEQKEIEKILENPECFDFDKSPIK